jgi:hypothetical protein
MQEFEQVHEQVFRLVFVLLAFELLVLDLGEEVFALAAFELAFELAFGLVL